RRSRRGRGRDQARDVHWPGTRGERASARGRAEGRAARREQPATTRIQPEQCTTGRGRWRRSESEVARAGLRRLARGEGQPRAVRLEERRALFVSIPVRGGGVRIAGNRGDTSRTNCLDCPLLTLLHHGRSQSWTARMPRIIAPLPRTRAPTKFPTTP